MSRLPSLETADSLARTIAVMARKIGARKADLPTIGVSSDFGHPHIEVTDDGYNYVVDERGRELKRVKTADLDEFLYLVFVDVALLVAMRFAQEHPEPHRDSRRAYFKKQEELLGSLNTGWQQKCEEAHSVILSMNPFDDDAMERATYCKQLRDNGMSNDEAWKLACDRYPLGHT
jgi:hypothetical protein